MSETSEWQSFSIHLIFCKRKSESFFFFFYFILLFLNCALFLFSFWGLIVRGWIIFIWNIQESKVCFCFFPCNIEEVKFICSAWFVGYVFFCFWFFKLWFVYILLLLWDPMFGYWQMCQIACVYFHLCWGFVLSGVQFWNLDYVWFHEWCSNVVEIALMLALVIMINGYFWYLNVN